MEQSLTRRPVRIVWAWAYLIIAWVLLASVAVQVFIAGLAVFVGSSYWEWHRAFVHFFEMLPPVLIALAFAGRLPRLLRWLPVAIFLLVIVQYATAEMPAGTSVRVLAALHPVSALIIFWVAVRMVRGAWRGIRPVQAEQRNGQAF